MTFAPPGLSLECDSTGTITRILHDEQGLLAHDMPPKSFMMLLHPSSWLKGRAFFEELTTSGAAYGYELIIRVGEDSHFLHVTGVRDSDHYLIIGDAPGSTSDMLDEIVSINNDQANQLRYVERELAARGTPLTEHHYDELSRVNNELANLQRQLARSNAHLARLNEQKNQFLGMAAHDLRAPLDVIMMYSDFIQAEAGDALTPEHYEFLNIIQQSSHFMLQLINDFLDVSIIESGQLRLEPQPVDLVDLVRQNVDLNEIIARRKSITIRTEAAPAPVLVFIDPDRLHQALNNLLTNAIKFSEPGTQVTVTVTCDDDLAHIAVRDQGEGIPAEQLDTLFDVYHNRSRRGTGGEKGNGLGLAITKKIITESRGTIEVESQPGVGTLLTITLPLQAGKPPQT